MFNDILQDYMIQKKFSQQQMAEILEVSQKVISNWLKGNLPQGNNVLLICKKLNITPNEIFTNEQNKQINNSFNNNSGTIANTNSFNKNFNETKNLQNNEQELIKAFNELSEQDKEKALKLIKALK